MLLVTNFDQLTMAQTYNRDKPSTRSYLMSPVLQIIILGLQPWEFRPRDEAGVGGMPLRVKLFRSPEGAEELMRLDNENN